MAALYILLCCLLLWVLARSKDLTMSEFTIACVILIPMLIIESQIIVDVISLTQIVPERIITNNIIKHDVVYNVLCNCFVRVFDDIKQLIPEALKQ